MTRDDIMALATYNAEVSRGIMHTPEWKAQMGLLQHEYETHYEAPEERGWFIKHGTYYPSRDQIMKDNPAV